MAATLISLCVVLLAQLVPVDPSIHSDDFMSVSCPDRRSCLILDNAGNLWFAPGGEAKLVRRSNQKKIGLVQIAFTGLIDGWGLDNQGGLWRSRNGGRIFQPVPLPGGSPASGLRAGAEVWLGSRDGSLYRLHRKKKAKAIAKIRGGDRLKLFDFNNKGLIAAATRDGSLLVSADRGKKWTQTRPPGGDITGLAVDQQGRIVVSGCRGSVLLSGDSGKTFKPLKLPETPGSWRNVCVTSGGFLANGKFLLLGVPGHVLIGDASSGNLLNFTVGPERNWRDAARLGRSGAMLVGDGGARARLRAGSNRELSHSPLGESRSTVTDIQVVNRRHVWATFMDGEIHYSADGGKKWESFPRMKEKTEPVRISFVDDKRGFALGGHHRVLSTTDGGRTWKTQGNWPDAFLNDTFFIDRQTGWAVGKIGCLVRTTDGGKTWTLDRLPTDRDLNQIQFVDKQRGWAVGDKQAVFRTSDGGRSWSRMLSGRGSLYSLYFESSGEGWVCGDAGIVLHTTDGGDSWTPQPAPTHETLRAIAFLGKNRGLIGGEQGQVFLTKDGGKTWKQLDLNSRTRVVSIACDRRSARCLVGGDRGLLLYGNPFRFHP
jgi:photosystem II stability/assembly factor-like uncharacterized protein